MKQTQLYFCYAKFFYDCHSCGHLNNVQVDEGGFSQGHGKYQKTGKDWLDVKVQLKCEKCGAQRFSYLKIGTTYPFNNKVRAKKLRKKQLAFQKKQKATHIKYIESLKKKPKKKVK